MLLIFQRSCSPGGPLLPPPPWGGGGGGAGRSFRFQHFHHLVGCGVGCALLEEAGNGKDGVAHADFRHTVRAAVCFGGACLFRFCHRLSFRCFISCFKRSSFSCAVSFRKLLPVKRTGAHMEVSLS